MIADRTKAGLAAAKARGIKPGNAGVPGHNPRHQCPRLWPWQSRRPRPPCRPQATWKPPPTTQKHITPLRGRSLAWLLSGKAAVVADMPGHLLLLRVSDAGR
jgi:hypothetical protein